MASAPDVIVIGGGVIGVCAAHYLRQEGASVTIIERNEIGSGCSFGNAGYVSPSHFVPLAAPGVLAKGIRWMLQPESPFYIKPRLDAGLLSWVWKFRSSCRERRSSTLMPLLRDLNLASAGLFAELSRNAGFDFGFQTRGLFMLYNSEKGEHEQLEAAGLADKLGVEARVMTTDQINRLDPGLQSHARGGVYYPQDCHLDPSRFVQGMGELVAKSGVQVLTSTTVLGFDYSKGSIAAVATSRGKLASGEFVVAGGSWSPGILEGLGLRIPLQPAKGYSVTIDHPPRSMSIPAILTEAKVAITPLGPRLRFAGTLELAGLDLSINRRRVGAILRAVPSYLSGFRSDDYAAIEPWAGLRPCSPDGVPFVGRFAQCRNLIAATGHAMLGVSLAPITGKLVSEIVGGKTPSVDLTPLSPDRFH